MEYLLSWKATICSKNLSPPENEPVLKSSINSTSVNMITSVNFSGIGRWNKWKMNNRDLMHQSFATKPDYSGSEFVVANTLAKMEKMKLTLAKILARK